MKLLYATSNNFKINNMKRRLKNLPIELLTIKDINIKINIEEDGNTVVENAIKKAQAYYDKTKIPTIAGDSSLFINEFSKKEQPGLFVRRQKGKVMTNEEMLNHYIKLINKYGGKCVGHYVTGLALITDNGLFTKQICEDDIILTKVKSKSNKDNGAPLAPISINPNLQKYYNEMTEEDFKKISLKFDIECTKFIEDYFLNK